MHAGTFVTDKLGVNGVGALWDDKTQQFLPFTFGDKAEAAGFLEAAERVGLNLWGGMSNAELKPLVALWRDANKRREPIDPANIQTP